MPMPNDIIDLQMKLLKAFDDKDGPAAFIKDYNDNPDEYKQYHDDIRILKALSKEQPKKFLPEMIKYLNQMNNPPNPSYSEMDEQLRNSFRMALKDDLNRDIILSKMSLPALTKLHEDFSQDFQKTKNVKSQVIYQTLLTKVQQEMDEISKRRTAFIQAGSKQEEILSKMTLPELEKFREDFDNQSKNAKDQKFRDVCLALLPKIEEAIDKRNVEKQPTPEAKQPTPEAKKSLSFKLFSKKHDKEHGDKHSFGQKMKETVSRIIPGRKKG